MADASAPKFEARVFLSLWNGDESLGVLSPIIATGSTPTRVDLGDQLVTVPSSTRTYAVHGVVVSAAAIPLVGVSVALESLGIGQRTALGTASTDDDGKAVLTYDGGPRASAADTDVRLQLTASHEGVELARSPVLFSLRDGQEIRLVATQDVGNRLSEREQITAAITGPLDEADLGALTLNEVEILAQQADVYPPHLALLVRATALAVNAPVDIDELYAMGRAGMPMTVAGLLAHDGEAFRGALSRAFARKIIPTPERGEAAAIDSIPDRMASWAGTFTVDPATATARWSNLAHSGVSATTREEFATKWLSLTGTLAERWEAVRADPVLSAAAPVLEFTAGASVVVGEHGPAVQALVDARTAGQVTTLRDLAAWDLADWTTALTGVGVPEALTHLDPTEATAHLARTAMRMVDMLHPGAGLARELATSTEPALTEAGRFLRDNANFDLDRTVLSRYAAANPGVFAEGEAGEAQRAALATVQRVHALTPGIERPQVTSALLALGIDSAATVARLGSDAFVAQHGATLEGLHPFLDGRALAKTIHQQAIVRHGATVAIASQFGKAFAGAPMTVLPEMNMPDGDPDPAIATLRALFGSQDFCGCEHCRSVYGPAAYLVALLSLLEGQPAITEPNDALDVLRQRRPDLTDLELSCANTNTVMPYIDLLLELLEARALDPEAPLLPRQTTRTASELRLGPEHRLDAAYSPTEPNTVANAVYPWGLPFDLSVERARAYCAQLGASRLEIMDTLRDRAGDDSAAAMDRLAEALSLTPASLQLISGGTANELGATTPQEAWGMTGGGWVAALADDVGDVLRRSGLDFEGLRDHLALVSIDPGGTVSVVPSCNLADAQIDGLDEGTLDRLQRFVRLERATGLPAIELDRGVRRLGGTLDASTLQGLSDAHGLARSLDQELSSLLVLWADLDIVDYDDDPSPYAQRFRSRLVTPQLDLAFALVGDDLAPGVVLSEAHIPTIRAALSLSDAELQVLIEQVLPPSPLLSLGTLSALARHARLARLMRLPIAELVVLRALIASDPFASPSETRAFIDAVVAFHDAGLSTERLDYLARDRASASSGLDPSDAAIDDVYAALFAALQAIESPAEAADLDALREEALVQVLAAAVVLPADATRALVFDRLHEGGASLHAVMLAPAFLGDGTVQTDQRTEYRRLHKAALVVRTLQVPTADFGGYFGGDAPDRLLDLDQLPIGAIDEGRVHVEGIERVRLGRVLQAELSTDDDIWTQATAASNVATAAELLAMHSPWDAADLVFVMTDLLGYDAESPPSGLRQPAALAVLRDVALLVRRTGVRAQTLAGWVVPRVTAPVADALLSALKARYDDETWPRVITPIADRLRSAQRDALVAFILGRGDFADEIALYDHLLVDPQMGACMLTSRLRLATAAVQLFIQRVLMNLEQEEVTFPPAVAERWSWMKTYRAWEANRKVFFYPENWIEPELRDDKSPFFEELEQHLQQAELTDAHVEAGYRAYLRKLHAVSHLEVPALCAEDQGEHQVVHVLGRTRGLPPKYWYRQRIDDRVWTPWVEVPVDIPGNQVAIATHNRRLFVLWLEPEEHMTEPADADDKSKQKIYQQVRVGWTEYRDGQWSPKKLTPLSGGNTDPAHGSGPQTLHVLAYERDAALYVDVLYKHGTLFQLAMFRYDDCRDTLEEVKRSIDYGYKDLGVSSHGRLDGQRAHYLPALTDQLQLGHWVSPVYFEKALLDACPDEFWVTAARQSRRYEGHTPVVFDDADHAFYIVPSNHWTFRGGHTHPSDPPRVPYSVDPWGALGGLTMQPDASTETTVPLAKGAMPWGGKVPGLAGLTRTETSAASSSGAMAGRGGATSFASVGTELGASPFGVLSATAEILDAPSAAFAVGGNTVLPDPAAADGVWVEHWAYRIDAFHHPYTCPLLSSLGRYGLPGVLAPAHESALHRQRADVEVLGVAGEYVPIPSNVVEPYPRDDFDFMLGGAYSVYNWELFVHAPLLIAERLRREQRFEEAQRWYHFVFNPLQGIESGGSTGPARFWNAKPLHQDLEDGPVDVIKAVMADEGLDADPALVINFFESVYAWVLDPFSPHAIARVRAGTYQKAIVRKYLDNLIEWADSLFRRDTMESIGEATQIYLLAASILGPQPQRLPAIEPPVRTYDTLIEPGLFGGLTELESFVPAKAGALPWSKPGSLTLGHASEQAPPFEKFEPMPSPVWWAFCLPANDQLLAYWDRVGDRLFKIRHCQNIEGVERALALFEPPIDPALLVRAKAAGVDLGSALADLSAPLPRHRFAVLRGRAQELVGDVRALGGALLSALEKRDAEVLGRLRSQHEVAMLEATRAARTLQIEEAQVQLDGLRKQRATVVAREAYYAGRKKISSLESKSLALGATAASLQIGIQTARALAGVLQVIPEFKAGIAGLGPELTVAIGGKNFGPAAQIAGDVLDIVGSIAQYRSQLTSTLAGYQRREDDWKFQAAQAKAEVKSLDKQIIAAEIRGALAKLERTNHDRQLEHAKEVETFLRTKFTNDALYDWTVGQVSTLYFQSYKLAHDMARKAEKALQRELGRDDLVFIAPAYWDGLRKGLLAGERLALDLRRMEVAQLEHDRRELELIKRVSLRLLDPAALMELRETGTCDFAVPEVVFDLDHPGHYFRRLKTVSLSIPAVAGPQVSLGATLTLLRHETRIGTASPPGGYVRQSDEDARFRIVANDLQSIATSRGRDDAGVFELSFREEKFLPFEGAGAISDWRIELPDVRQFDYRTITDVELELRYTARADGGLRTPASDAVTAAIDTLFDATAHTGLLTVLTATKDFPTEWERLLRPAEGEEGEPLSIPIVPERFPYVARERGIEVDSVRFVFVGDPEAISTGGASFDATLLRPVEESTVSFGAIAGLREGTAMFNGVPPVPPPEPPEPAPPSDPVVLEATPGPWSLLLPTGAIVDPDRIHDLWVLVRYHVTSA